MPAGTRIVARRRRRHVERAVRVQAFRIDRKLREEMLQRLQELRRAVARRQAGRLDHRDDFALRMLRWPWPGPSIPGWRSASNGRHKCASGSVDPKGALYFIWFSL
jgi:hypothetical protein